MSNTPNELHDEFPEHAARLHALKMSDAHFVRLAEDYHRLNRDIHRAETDVEPTSDEHLETMKKQRLHLKDEIAAILARDS